MFSQILSGSLLLSILFGTTKLSGYLEPKTGGIHDPLARAHLISVSDQEVILDFSAPAYSLQNQIINGDSYQNIIVQGATEAQSDTPGGLLFQMPVLGALIGVPAQVSFEVRILSQESERISGKYRLPPVISPEPINEDLSPGRKIYKQPDSQVDSLVSLGSDGFPVSPVQINSDAWLRDQRILSLSFYPFKYQPDTGELTWYRSLRVGIRFIGESPTQSSSLAGWPNNPFEQALKDNLINYEAARAWRSPRSGLTDPSLAKDNQTPITSGFDSQASKYRISINKDGLYRLTFENLKLSGIPVDTVSVQSLALTNQGRAVDFYFEDLDHDLIFDPGESLIFYGQKFYGDWMANRYTGENANWMTYLIQQPDGTETNWKPSMNAVMLEKYTDENVYWLSPGVSTGNHLKVLSEQVKISQSMETPAILGSPVYLPLVSKKIDFQYYPQTIRLEKSVLWKTTLFAGEDTWFWDEIKTSSSATRSYTARLTAPASVNTTARLSGELVAAAYNDSAGPDHFIQVFFNDPTHHQPVFEANWDGKSRFHFDAQIDQKKLVDGDNQIDLVVHKTASLSLEDIFVDWFEVEYARKFVAENNRITFSDQKTGLRTFQISGYSTPEIEAFDITNPLAPQWVSTLILSNNSVRFEMDQSSETRYYVGEVETVPTTSITAYYPMDISSQADYLIITHSSFLAAAQSLADYRAGQGYTARVIDIADLYNEFNDGIYNPIAIKNFLVYAFTNWSVPPSYVLLAGDGHWNFKGFPTYDSPPIYIPPFLSWVDPWQGEVDSANLLATVVGNDPLPDVQIGRLPVNSAIQLSDAIAKTISFEQSPPQDWKKRLLFIADNTPDPAGDFVALSEQVITNNVPPEYTISRIYLDNFTDTNLCNPPPPGDPRTCPAATQTILSDLNTNGAYLASYVGHGSLNFWANEQIFTNQDIPFLVNGNKLPIFLSMTCLDGYWIHPNVSSASKSGPSLAEELVRAPQNGAVATFSPTGLGVATGHDVLHQGFFEAVFQANARDLGEAALSAKLRSYASGANFDLLHTFTIFGDPALRLPSKNTVYLPLINH